MYVGHKTPCDACPFRKNSVPGWLGADTAEGFIQNINADVHLPCHSHVDYERDDWRKQAEKAPFCAGAMQMMRNCGKLPLDPELVKARNQYERNPDVFAFPHFFIEHHKRKPDDAGRDEDHSEVRSGRD